MLLVATLSTTTILIKFNLTSSHRVVLLLLILLLQRMQSNSQVPMSIIGGQKEIICLLSFPMAYHSNYLESQTILIQLPPNHQQVKQTSRRLSKNKLTSSKFPSRQLLRQFSCLMLLFSISLTQALLVTFTSTSGTQFQTSSNSRAQHKQVQALWSLIGKTILSQVGLKMEFFSRNTVKLL